MRVLIDINHPGQVHLFMPVAKHYLERGGDVLVTARDKEMTLELLHRHNVRWVAASRQRSGVLGLLVELLQKTWGIFRVGLCFRPQVIVSLGSPPAAFCAFLLSVPHIALEDTEHSTEQALLYLPFTRYVLTPAAFTRSLGNKQRRYNGYHELAYLHPSVFSPDPAALVSLGLRPGQRYSVVRFVSWQASHDLGRKGLSYEEKKWLVDLLLLYGPVVLSSEAAVPPDLAERCLRPNPHAVHHLLAYAHLYVGEGATMASEAAMLGCPAVYTNPLSAGTLEEQERYGLVYRVTEFQAVCERVAALMDDPHSSQIHMQRRDGMLACMEDVIQCIVDTIEEAVQEQAP